MCRSHSWLLDAVTLIWNLQGMYLSRYNRSDVQHDLSNWQAIPHLTFRVNTVCFDDKATAEMLPQDKLVMLRHFICLILQACVASRWVLQSCRSLIACKTCGKTWASWRVLPQLWLILHLDDLHAGELCRVEKLMYNLCTCLNFGPCFHRWISSGAPAFLEI